MCFALKKILVIEPTLLTIVFMGRDLTVTDFKKLQRELSTQLIVRCK